MIGSRAEPRQRSSQGHVYRSGKLLRMEEPGGEGYFITDLSSGESYGIAEAGCIHDDHPYIRAVTRMWFWAHRTDSFHSS